MHWLPNFSAPARIRSGLASAQELMLILSAPALQHRVHVFDGSDSAADGERHETLVRGAFDDIHHRGAAMGAGGDVEENHFVRALVVVADGEFDRVADVAQFARFGFAELDAARDLAVMDVETRNDTFCDHRARRR